MWQKLKLCSAGKLIRTILCNVSRKGSAGRCRTKPDSVVSHATRRRWKSDRADNSGWACRQGNAGLCHYEFHRCFEYHYVFTCPHRFCQCFVLEWTRGRILATTALDGKSCCR